MKELDKKIKDTFSFKTDQSYKDEFWKSFDKEFQEKKSYSSLFNQVMKFYIPSFLVALTLIMFTSLYFIDGQKHTDSVALGESVTVDFLDSYEMSLEEDESDYDQSFI